MGTTKTLCQVQKTVNLCSCFWIKRMLSYNGSAKFWNVIRSIRKLVQTENEQTEEKKKSEADGPSEEE